MIKKIINSKLRTKLIIGFQFVIFLMLMALGFGIVGMQNNKQQFTGLKVIADEQLIAMDIIRNLSEAKMNYEAYLVKGDQEKSNSFNDNANKMLEYVQYYRDISSEKERLKIIDSIEKNTGKFQNEFENIIDQEKELEKIRVRWFNDGDKMLEILRDMEEIALNSEIEDTTVFSDLSKSLEYLLNARLVAFKYYTFNDLERYREFTQLFSQLETYIDNVEIKTGDLSFTHLLYEFTSLKQDYEACMQEMKATFEERAKSGTNISIYASFIDNNLREIIQSVNNEKEDYMSMVSENQKRYIRFMFLFALISIVASIIIIRALIKLIITPILHITGAFNGISKGDVNFNFRLKDNKEDEFGLLARAFNRFMIQLKKIVTEMDEQNWIKTAETALNDKLSGKESLEDVGSSVIEFLCEYVQGQVGTIYILEEEKYRLKGGFAVKENVKDSIASGEGIIGQAIAEKRIMTLDRLPEGYVQVSSSLGSTEVNNVVVIPCIKEEEVLAVIEIGKLGAITESEKKFFNILAINLGNIISSIKSNMRVKKLLDIQLEQAEVLQTQQEELMQNNEELEEQTRILIESERQLQFQKEELKVSNEELENRTKELEYQKKELDFKNEELIEAQKVAMEKAEALEVSNKYKTEFLANMSHELRTPLNSILVLSELLKEKDQSKPLTQKEKEFASTINSSGKDLLSIINDILDLSKVEAGYLDVKFSKVDLRELINHNKNLFTPLTDSKGIGFEATIEKGIGRIIVSDELRINQIIRNLLSNAVKFTEKGKVQLNIRNIDSYEKKNLDIKEESIVIEVKDTGIGIRDTKKDIIFEAFRQSDGTTSRKYGGTGLGLTICRELAKLLHGQIILESEYGYGSTFSLIIPVNPEKNISVVEEDDFKEEIAEIIPEKKNEKGSIQENNDEEKIEEEIDIISEEAEKKRAKESPELKREKLLIIEDDEVFANVLGELANKKGFEVVIANNGKSGIEKAMTEEISAIILDLGLPDMDGKLVAEKLRKIDITNNIPIHIISGREESVELHDNVIGYIKKPVDIKDIYETLGKIEEYTDNSLKKLLVVGKCGGEDFEYFRDLANVELVKVLTAEEGLELLKKDKYECIVMDINLHSMKGKDFIKKVNNEIIAQDRKIPFIIYTDETVGQDFEDIEEVVNSIILKSPKSQERLVDEIGGFLQDMSSTTEKEDFQGNIAEKEQGEISKIKGKKVLIVDDDERNIYALTNLLEIHGIEVLSAENGDKCIEILGENRDVDLIFMDIMMPVKDGIATIKEIRENEYGEQKKKFVPIIALTAKVMKDDVDEVLEVGANDYLAKPIEVESLFDKMKVWINGE